VSAEERIDLDAHTSNPRLEGENEKGQVVSFLPTDTKMSSTD
jgi:hypothetical protein